MRLGIGHPGHKDRVAAYVLADFAKADADWLDDLQRGISDGAPALAAGDGPRFLNAVAQRMAPARNSGKGPEVAPAPAKAQTPKPSAQKPSSQAEQEPDTRSPLQKLADRFRG